MEQGNQYLVLDLGLDPQLLRMDRQLAWLVSSSLPGFDPTQRRQDFYVSRGRLARAALTLRFCGRRSERRQLDFIRGEQILGPEFLCYDDDVA